MDLHLIMNKALITTVPFGNLSIEGLLLSGSTKEQPVFGVAIVQASSHFNYYQTNIKRDGKRFLGERFAVIKTATELDSRKIDVLPLPVFEALTFEFAMRGNKLAQEFVRGLFGLSLHQLFCDAFDLKFEREDRQLWLIERQDGKTARKEFTDMVKNLEASGFNVNYGWLTLCTYEAIGIRGKYHQWKNDSNAKLLYPNFRDTLSTEEIRVIKEAELYITVSVEDYKLTLQQAFDKAKRRYNKSHKAQMNALNNFRLNN